MKRLGLIRFVLLSLSVAAICAAQTIPGRYIVEFREEPVAALAVPSRLPLTSSAEPSFVERRRLIRAEQGLAEQSIRSWGGRVLRRFDTLLNGIVVDLDDAAAARLRQMPNVRSIYPDVEVQMSLDRAINVHKVREAWQTIAGGQAGAGAGIKIGIIDSGIDTAHPGFQGFTAAMPSGFPKASSETIKAQTNNKVIVVRDYTGEAGTDLAGHGTGVAMTAAGMIYDGKVAGLGPLSGIAPGAWLGSYRVFDSNGRSSISLFVTALEEAVADGMNVVNFSGGFQLTDSNREENGPEARALRTAAAAGVLVVVAVGNNGPEPGTVAFPGASANTIAAGANFNERIFDDGITLGDLPGFPARPASNTNRTDQIQAAMVDVATLDQNGFGCSPLPPASLKGKIALISRGSPTAESCFFDQKANNAELAGAVAVVVYNNAADAALISMTIDTATVPAMFIHQSSGTSMKRLLASAPESQATVDFSGFTPLTISSDSIASFTSGGPTPSGGLKPDILATGYFLATADTTVEGQAPFLALQAGTSFSSPIVAGAAAVLMSARPGLTAAQYKSLLIDSAPRLNWSTGTLVDPQIGGSGKLDLSRSLQNPTAATPATLSFQAVNGTYSLTKSLVVTNLGADTDTFTISAQAVNLDGAVPSFDTQPFTLSKGASKTVEIKMAATDPAAGEYHGFLEIAGTKSTVTSRVPYWLGVRGSAAKYIAVLNAVDSTRRSLGDEVSVLFRVLDAAGMPMDAGTPEIATTAPRASVIDVSPTGNIPGTYTAILRAGRADANGENVFTISAGGKTRDIVFIIR